MALQLTQEQKAAGWQIKQIREIATVVTGGTPSKNNPEYWGDNTPFLTPSDQVFGVRQAVTSRFLSVEGKESFSRRMVDSGAVAITCIGATIGKASYVQVPTVTNQQINSLVADEKQAHGLYLYYLFTTLPEELYAIASGSATPIVSKSVLENFKVAIPSYADQKGIAEILGSMDDKIEANSRLIQNLEDLADLTFDRYLEDLSEVLEDTTYGSLNFFGGGTPNTKNPDYWDGEVNWVTPTDVTSLKFHTLFESSRKITEAGLAACSSKLHPAGSIMMTSRATIGRFAVNQVPAATNQGFIVVQPANEYERWWIYHSMKKDVELFLLLANGATFLELNRRVFKDIPLKMFRGETELPAIHNQIIALETENKGLIETRDLLIRHLIG